MNVWLRAQRAEMLKLKGTFGLWLVLLMPVAVAALVSLVIGAGAYRAKAPPSAAPAQIWLSLGDHMFVMWSLLMVPLFVTLQTAWLAGLEHGNDQWKHLLALPLPRAMHYLVKLTTVVAMLVGSYILLWALVALAGWVLMLVAPRTGLAGLPPLGALVVPAACSLGACLLIVTVQTWIALRWRSFSVPISVGVVATIAALLVSRTRFGQAFPWSMPVQAFVKHGQHMESAVWLGVIGGLVVGALGLLDFLRRDNV